MTTPNTELIKPKQHFEILDGLRGVAALAIVFFHFMEKQELLSKWNLRNYKNAINFNNNALI